MSGTTQSFPRGPANDSILGEFIDRNTLRFVRDFPHPATAVWEAITDREQVTRWLWPCTLFEARAGGRYSFEDSGMKWGGTISVFEPPTRLQLDIGLFEIFERSSGSRLILTLKRPRSGWSPMTLAGFMGWLGRLTRLLDKAPQADVELFASDIWEAMWPAYERLLRHHVTGGAKAVYRLHFAPNDPALGPEAKSHLDVLSALMHERNDLAVVIDGYGDDPCSMADSVKLSAQRMNAASKYLEQSGIDTKRLIHGFALGNYHQLVPSDTEAGRSFNRRIELQPTY